MQSSNKILLAAAILTAAFSCKKDPVYNVPASIQPYVDEFIAEAAARGQDLEIDDLVVIFEGDLEVDGVAAAGLCSKSRKNPPTIKLDTSSINWQANLSSREQLVFHELGHCVLNRSHLDSRLDNGNYVTMMRPSGEQLYGPVMSAFKRVYYLDEMFLPTAPAPMWSQNPLLYSAVSPGSKTYVYEEDFNDTGGGWSTGESSSTIRAIEGGFYILTVKVAGNYFVANELEIDDSRDFELEASVRVEGNGFSGLLWAGADRGSMLNPSYNTVFFDSDVVSIGTLMDGTESSYTFESFFNELYNKVTVRRIGTSYYFYVNENLVDNMEFNGIRGAENGLSFGGFEDSRITFDYLTLAYLD